MAAVTQPLLRKLLSLGSGVGIRIDGDALHLAALRVRPGGVSLLGAIVIEDFRQRPAADWGAEYSRFLAASGLQNPGAIVILPRQELIVRTLALPGVTDSDAPAALRFQLDGLHPYDEAEVVHDWQRIGRTSSFVVAIARRETIDAYTALFAEAGVPLAGFSYSASAIYHAARILQQPAPETLAVSGLHANSEAPAGTQTPLEIYGESASAPLFSADFELGLDRALALARSQLRLSEEFAPLDIAGLLPAFQATKPGQDLSDPVRSQLAIPCAAALAAACPHLGAPVNLLPPELRRGVSRAVYIPTAILALLLLGLGLALLLQGRWMEKAYVQRLDTEIRRLQPSVTRTKDLVRQSAQLLGQIREIDSFRSSARRDLDLLLDLTRLIDPPGYAQQLSVSPTQVNLAGEVDQAEGLLKKLEASPLLKNLEFTSPLQRNPMNQSELFRVKAEREAAR
jgi:hypothetical protein